MACNFVTLEAQDFPLICTPVALPWFDAGYRYSEFAVSEPPSYKLQSYKVTKLQSYKVTRYSEFAVCEPPSYKVTSAALVERACKLES